jgi:ribose transport system permease protein
MRSNLGTLIAPYAIAGAIFLVTAELIPGYASINSVLSVLLLASLLGIAAIGQTLTIILGGFDLSIPAVMGLADVLVAALYGGGWPMWAVIPIVLTSAIVVGVFNGLTIRLLRVSSLIVTLATGSIVLGGILSTTHGQVGGSVPEWLTSSVSVVGSTFGLPLPGAVVLWIALAVLVIVFERRMVLGRWMFAIGANPRAADLARVPSLTVWLVVYAISAGTAAIAGMLLAGLGGAADAGVGAPYLFTTLAAVVVGGTSLLGGRGSYERTVAGSLLIITLSTLLIGLGFDQPAQQICFGILIVVLVAFYGREPHVRMRV